MDRGDHRMSDGILGTSRGLEWHRAVAPVSEVGEITAHELALSSDIAGRRNALNLEETTMTDQSKPYTPLTTDNSALVLVDHQVGLMTGVRDYETGELKHRSEERRVGKECRSRWSPYH